ncbi:MAG: hypothetical protein PVH19_07380 [Planctomycetia bacterium]
METRTKIDVETDLQNSDQTKNLRRAAYAIMITVSLGLMLGRIAAVESVSSFSVNDYKIKSRVNEKRRQLAREGFDQKTIDEKLEEYRAELHEKLDPRRPFLSANDRSRWCTVRALVEPEMRVEGAPYAIDRVIQKHGWDSIDKVKHDGHLYSSKPTLFPTLMAAEYWLIYNVTDMSLGTHPYAVIRFMVATINGSAMLILLLAVAGMVERLGKTDWGRLFAMAVISFATFLSTFVVTINNHTIGAACAAVTLYAAMRILVDEDRRVRWFILGGLAAMFLAANELPALSMAAAIGVLLLWYEPRRTLLWAAPAAAVVVAGFFATNYIAHENFKPPYMHRKAGDNWYDYEYERNGRTIESYWRTPAGLDQGEKDTAVYAANATVGHHGIFSLTPVWILSVVGLAIGCFRTNPRRLWMLIGVITAVSVVCVIFFLFIEGNGRNYGGMTSGFRWVFWLAPLWVVGMLPVVDGMGKRRWTRAICLILLAISAFSAAYPTWNPWSHPWLYRWLEYLGV